ncbi:WYL domain-containing protein [Myroides sp. LJL115]
MASTKEPTYPHRNPKQIAQTTQAALLLLDNFLFSAKKYGRKSFTQALEDAGLEYSRRKVDNVLHYLAEMGIELIDDRKTGYVLKEAEEEELTTILAHNLKKKLGLELIHLRLNTNPSLDKYIQLESHKFRNYSMEHQAYDGGLRWVDTCLSALITNSKINLIHTKFEEGTTTEHKNLIPLFLKEYLNRWYIVVKPPKGKDPKVFGLDRVQEIEVTKTKFEPEADTNYDIFKDAIGVDLRNDQEIIQLKFTEEQKNYIKTNFLHHSQKILEDCKEYVTISLNVNLNYEIKRVILSYGAKVEVLEPDSLRKWISEEITKMENIYK